MSYASHLAELRPPAPDSRGFRLHAIISTGSNRRQLLSQAAEEYRRALSAYERIVLTFHVEAAIIPKVFGNRRVDLDQTSDADLDQLYGKLLAAVPSIPLLNREYEDDRAEYARYINRCAVRLTQLAGYGQRSILQIHSSRL